MAQISYERIALTGIVQGIGMRPFICREAENAGVAGYVLNAGGIVEVFAKADAETLEAFVKRLTAPSIFGARVDNVTRDRIPPFACDGFRIKESGDNISSGELTADLPVCGDCAREMRNAENRRYRHALISCVSCGPRFSILDALPYDRENTAMDGFDMCPECRAEYTSHRDRRFHAQTVSCHSCGPMLQFWKRGVWCPPESAMDTVLNGGIIAVKGIGGYHAVALPTSENAVKRLRALKGREQKPFAVLFSDIKEIEAVCAVMPDERELLLSPARPIVPLMVKRGMFVPQVSAGIYRTGCFLAYTPLQLLLLEKTGPLIFTSLNYSGCPIITDDREALDFDGLDGVLLHDRAIRRPLDDSVAQSTWHGARVVRRGRGIVPLSLSMRGNGQVLAMGGDLKAAFCAVKGGRAILSAPVGDLETLKAREVYREEIGKTLSLLRMKPELVVCDTHPLYASAALAGGFGANVLPVQHHHAHIAAVMAEHRLTGKIIGVAFDGTGYGDNGAVWGGEILVCDEASFERTTHLPEVPVTGGDKIAKDARLMLDCCLIHAGLEPQSAYGEIVGKALKAGVNTVATTSAGRLFDAVSAYLGICHENAYEGQCGMLLEQAAELAASSGGTAPRLTIERLWHELAELEGADSCLLALSFHQALADWTAGSCREIRQQNGLNRVALSGGVFQNALLLGLAFDALEALGFQVYFNRDFPSGDGALSLGQAYIGMHHLSGKD